MKLSERASGLKPSGIRKFFDLISGSDVISLGNTSVKCVSTPGHTDGTTSFFFDVTDGKDIYRAGMHGGIGMNSMKTDFLKERGLPTDCRQKFLDGLDRVQNEKVDIVLGNHASQNDTEGKLARLSKEDKNPFIDSAEWGRFIDSCRKRMDRLQEEDPCQMQ